VRCSFLVVAWQDEFREVGTPATPDRQRPGVPSVLANTAWPVTLSVTPRVISLSASVYPDSFLSRGCGPIRGTRLPSWQRVGLTLRPAKTVRSIHYDRLRAGVSPRAAARGGMAPSGVSLVPSAGSRARPRIRRQFGLPSRIVQRGTCALANGACRCGTAAGL